MRNLGWSPIPWNGGTYTHAKTGAAMVACVDDMMMLSRPGDTSMLWRALEESVDYKDPEAPMARYLGALYKFLTMQQTPCNVSRFRFATSSPV